MTDYLIERRTPRNTTALDILYDPGQYWRKAYPDEGVVAVELKPGEADRIILDDIISYRQLRPSLQATLDKWREVDALQAKDHERP